MQKRKTFQRYVYRDPYILMHGQICKRSAEIDLHVQICIQRYIYIQICIYRSASIDQSIFSNEERCTSSKFICRYSSSCSSFIFSLFCLVTFVQKKALGENEKVKDILFSGPSALLLVNGTHLQVIYKKMDEEIERTRQINGSIDRWINRQMERWLDGQME